MASTVAVYLDEIRKQLHKYAIVKKYADLVEEKTHVNAEYIVSGLGLVLLICVFFGLGAGIICNLIGFAYPMYATLHALETHDSDDDTQWLTYWVVFAFFGVIEGFSDYLLYWIPFYYALKLVFLIWCMLPQFNGAKIVYKHFILPQFQKHEVFMDTAVKNLDPKEAINAAMKVASAAMKGTSTGSGEEKDKEAKDQ